jgi:RNA polymerase sigma-70 factor (ECF subfamily)
MKLFINETYSKTLSAEELNYHIRECVLNNRKSQKIIYSCFFGYAMSICQLHAHNYEDAVGILNDGFLKVFKEIHRYKPAYEDVISSFKGWVRKIIACTVIDHFRKNHKHQEVTGLDDVAHQLPSIKGDSAEKQAHQEIIRALRVLPHFYQAVLYLFAVGGLGHEEIAEKLDISIDTSKSNLLKARKQLKEILSKQSNISM